MNNPKYCDLRVCAKASEEVGTDFHDETAVKAYRSEEHTSELQSRE